MTIEPTEPTEIERDSPEEDEEITLEEELEIEPLENEDVEDALEPPAPVDPDEVESQTRKSLTLKGRLRGIKHRSRKVLLFTDPEAAELLGRTNAALQGLTDAIGELGSAVLRDENGEPILDDEGMPTEDLSVALRREAFQSEYDRIESTLEDLKVAALAGALSVHLVGYPAIALKVARRAATKRFLDPVTKRVPLERQEEFSEFLENFLMGSSIVKIIDSDGDLLELPKRSEIADMLQEELPAPQWERLKLNFMQLNVEDHISQVVQDDPGF